MSSPSIQVLLFLYAHSFNPFLCPLILTLCPLIILNAQVKKSKELMDEFQNDKRTLHQQLAEERGRFDTLQRTYAADKATWDVCRNEMHAKLTRVRG